MRWFGGLVSRNSVNMCFSVHFLNFSGVRLVSRNSVSMCFSVSFLNFSGVRLVSIWVCILCTD